MRLNLIATHSFLTIILTFSIYCTCDEIACNFALFHLDFGRGFQGERFRASSSTDMAGKFVAWTFILPRRTKTALQWHRLTWHGSVIFVFPFLRRKRECCNGCLLKRVGVSRNFPRPDFWHHFPVTSSILSTEETPSSFRLPSFRTVVVISQIWIVHIVWMFKVKMSR